MAGGGAMPLVAGCGAMLRGDDGVVIGVAKAPSTTRGGHCVWQDDVVMGAATASSSARRSRYIRQVVVGDPRRRLENQD